MALLEVHDVKALACWRDLQPAIEARTDAGFREPLCAAMAALDFTEAEAAEGELSMWLFGHSIPSLVQFSAEKSMELFSGPIRVHLIAFGDEATAGYGAMVAAAGLTLWWRGFGPGRR